MTRLFPIRQLRQLAEGQTSADFKHFLIIPPPFYESSSSVKGEEPLQRP